MMHADRKSILEVDFIDEEGTGLGPTLEFFALVAGEFQGADLAMWLSDDSEQSGGQDMCSGSGLGNSSQLLCPRKVRCAAGWRACSMSWGSSLPRHSRTPGW